MSMLQIQDTILSLDILTEHFCCDLKKCKGYCCVHGDSGAPLEEHEVALLKQNYAAIKPYMRPEGIQAIENQGITVIDSDNDIVTPLVEKKECAFVIFEDEIATCAIEKAFFDKKSTFRKPVSCHLYPIRAKKYDKFTGLNYDRWDICKHAIRLGKEKNSKVFEFTEEALKVKFGEEWVKELHIAAEEFNKNKDIS